MKKPSLYVISCLLVTASAWMPPAHAGGSVAGVASEFTQILNNAELAASVAKQADMVREQVQTKLAHLQNLERMASGGIEQALSPYASQMQGYKTLMSSITALKASADRVGSVLSDRSSEFERSGLKDPAKYISYELGLAKRRGGEHQIRLQQDLAALDALQQRSQEFRRVAAQTSSITGNLQGLQQLSQLSAMAAGELMELKAAVLAQNADASLERRSSQDNAAWRAGIYEAARRGALERSTRPAPTGVDIDPLKAWGNLK